MDLHHLRHFLAVAEELHFGRAARRLGIAQPPLSQSIKRLEESMGAQLFDRGRGRVTLTPAGNILLPQARDILARVELAERLTRRAAEGGVDCLRVGCMPWSLTRAVPRALRRFKQRWPGVEVRIYEQVSRHQVAAVRRGDLDLGIVSLRLIDTEGLSQRIVERSCLVAAIPQGWAIAHKQSVRLAELAHAPFVVMAPQLSPRSHESFLSACRAAGFEPRIVQESAQPYTLLNMVANELGIALIQSTAAAMKVEGVSLVNIADAPSSFDTEIALVWQAQSLTPPLHALIDTIAEEAEMEGGPRGV
jgi:DNA-binding transcriptional LysR family regulator